MGVTSPTHVGPRDREPLGPLLGRPNRAASRCLARQGEAPIEADTKARPSGAMPRKSRRREGRRERESVRACTKEQSSGRTQERGWVKAHPGGFQGGGRHLDSSEAISLRGAVAEADLRPVRATWRRLQPPGSNGLATRVPGRCSRRGARRQGGSFARALPARATLHGAKASRGERGSLVIGVPPRQVLRIRLRSSMM